MKEELKRSRDVPTTPGGWNLITSFIIAVTYGRFGRSSKEGSLSFPTTLSSSSCAFLIADGFRTMARMKLRLLEVDYIRYIANDEERRKEN